MTAALSPKDLKEAAERGDHIPDGVIKAVNQLLKENASSTYIVLKQCDVVKAIKECMGVTTVPVKWLDFEPVFRKAGWKVEYDKPGYNESYEATFAFRA